MSSLREQFEAWIEPTAVQDAEGLFSRSKRDSEKYANPMLESEWQAYQAGHAASEGESKKTEAAILDLIKRLGKDQDKRCEDFKTYRNDFVTLEATKESYDAIMSVMQMLEDIDMGVYKFESEMKKEKTRSNQESTRRIMSVQDASRLAKEWCEKNPTWQRICDIPGDSGQYLLSWDELPNRDRRWWEKTYPGDPESAWREFAKRSNGSARLSNCRMQTRRYSSATSERIATSETSLLLRTMTASSTMATALGWSIRKTST